MEALLIVGATGVVALSIPLMQVLVNLILALLGPRETKRGTIGSRAHWLSSAQPAPGAVVAAVAVAGPLRELWRWRNNVSQIEARDQPAHGWPQPARSKACSPFASADALRRYRGVLARG